MRLRCPEPVHLTVALCLLGAGCAARTEMDPAPALESPTTPQAVGDGVGKATCTRQSTELAVVMQSLRAMAQDRDALYIANQVGLVRIDKQSDESVETVLPFIPRTIAVDGEFLYLEALQHEGGWRSTIHRMPKGSSAPDAVLWRSSFRISGLTASGGEVFFIEDGKLQRVSSLVPARFDTVEERVTSFSVDDHSIYALSEGSLTRRLRATAERQVVATWLSGELLGAAAGYVYLWQKEQSSIERLSVQGSAVERVAQADRLTDPQRASVVVDEKGIYFASYDSALYWVDLRGQLPRAPIKVAQGAPYDDDDFDAIVLEDEGYVYWIVGGPPADARYPEGGVVIVKRCRIE